MRAGPTGPERSAHRARGGRSGDRGSATIWLVSALTVLLLATVVAVLRGAAVLARHRAEAAADLAALAAASQIGVSDSGCRAAAVIAADNGARLTSCAVSLGPDGRSGSVTIRVAVRVSLPVVGARVASASARAGRLRAPPRALPVEPRAAVAATIGRGAARW